MFTESKIKMQAKQNLSKNNWSVAVAVTILFMGFSSIIPLFESLLVNIFNLGAGHMKLAGLYFNNQVIYEYISGNIGIKILIVWFLITLISALMIVFIGWPLSLGILHWSYLVANGKDAFFCEIFKYYKTKELFLKAINTQFLVCIRVIFWITICLIPSIVIFFVVGNLEVLNNDIIYLNGILFSISLSSIFFILGIIVAGLISLRYFLVPYFIVADDNESARNSITESISLMKKRHFDVLKLIITFIPWMLSCFFILPIIYVLPYFMVSLAISAKWIIITNNN